MLDIRHGAAGSASLSVTAAGRGVDARRWRGFFVSLPRPESVRLPPSVDVAAAILLRLVGRSYPNMRRMRLIGCVDICDSVGTGGGDGGPLLPRLETLVVGSLQPETKTRWVGRPGFCPEACLVAKSVKSMLSFRLCCRSCFLFPTAAAADRLHVVLFWPFETMTG